MQYFLLKMTGVFTLATIKPILATDVGRWFHGQIHPNNAVAF